MRQAQFPHLFHIHRQAGCAGTRRKSQQLHRQHRAHVITELGPGKKANDQRIAYQQDENQSDHYRKGVIPERQQQIRIAGKADDQIGHQREHPQRGELHHVTDDLQNNPVQRFDQVFHRRGFLLSDSHHRHAKYDRQQDQLQHGCVVAGRLHDVFGDHVHDELQRTGTFHLLRIGASLFDSLLVMTPELLGLFARKNVTGLNRIDDDQPDKNSEHSGSQVNSERFQSEPGQVFYIAQVRNAADQRYDHQRNRHQAQHPDENGSPRLDPIGHQMPASAGNSSETEHGSERHSDQDRDI